MDKKLLFSDYYKYSIACAAAYCIPAFFFFNNETFSNVWLLYLGSVLFAFAVVISDAFASKKLKNISRFKAMITAGLRITVSSICIICLIVTILAVIFRNHVLQQKPVNFISIYLLLPLSAILINMMAAAFCVQMGAFSMYKYEKNAKGEDIT